MIYVCTIHGNWDANQASGCPYCMTEARKRIAGAKAMLHEAAKQFRLLGSVGHAAMCDMHADSLDPHNAKVSGGVFPPSA